MDWQITVLLVSLFPLHIWEGGEAIGTVVKCVRQCWHRGMTFAQPVNVKLYSTELGMYHARFLVAATLASVLHHPRRAFTVPTGLYNRFLVCHKIRNVLWVLTM